MALDLVGSRRDLGHSQHTLDLLPVEVGHANGLDQAISDQLLHSLPGVHIIDRRELYVALLVDREEFTALLVGHRPVDQIEIQVLQLQGRQRILNGSLYQIRAMVGVPQFAGNEQVLTAKRLELETFKGYVREKPTA